MIVSPYTAQHLTPNCCMIVSNSLGALQRKKFKNLSLLWKWVDGSRSHLGFLFWDNHPNIAQNHY